MPYTRKHPFTMIEILLALGVIAIGICSIMVLFPIGANASRDAAMETYCANAAEELLHYYQFQLQSNNQWKELITDNGIKNSENEVILAYSDGWKSDWNALNEFPNIVQKSGTCVFLLTNIGNGKKWSELTDYNEINWAAVITVTKHLININGSNVNSNYGITLQAEVSWPAQAQVANRKKATYVLDVFKKH